MPRQWDKLIQWFRRSDTDPTPEVAVKRQQWVRDPDNRYNSYRSRLSEPPRIDPQTVIPPPKRAVHPDMVAASSSLGLTLHRHLARKAPEENLVVSPVSVNLALAMAVLGATGETREELTRVLGTERFPADELEGRYADLLQTLRSSAQEQELRIANSVWLNESCQLLPEYERSVTDCLNAKATSLPFSDAQSVQQINRWVEEQTNGKIGSILDSLSEQQLLILINCVYFKGLWDEPFEKERTKDRIFHGVARKRQRPFMHMRSGFDYLEDADGQAVCLKYGGFSSLQMWIFLPTRNMGLQRFLDNLKPSFWADVQRQSRHRPGTLALPRFKMECSNDLISGLQAAGIRRAFDHVRGEFAEMLAAPEPLYISAVKQKAYLEVTEEGTEAAAATYVEMMPTMAMRPERPPKPFEMIVDRPFFVAVGDKSSGLLLFTASVWEV